MRILIVIFTVFAAFGLACWMMMVAKYVIALTIAAYAGYRMWKHTQRWVDIDNPPSAKESA